MSLEPLEMHYCLWLASSSIKGTSNDSMGQEDKRAMLQTRCKMSDKLTDFGSIKTNFKPVLGSRSLLMEAHSVVQRLSRVFSANV